MPYARTRGRLEVQHRLQRSFQLAVAALAAAGYRAARSQHHYRVIHSLELTIGLDSRAISRLDAFRKKRNVTDYERADAVSDIEVNEIMSVAEDLRRDVEAWIRKHHRR